MMSKIQEFKTEVAEFLQGIIAFINPVSPAMWLPMAEALSHCPGWMPSMLLVSFFVMTMIVNALIGQWLNGPIVEVFQVTTWATWGLVFCLAMSIGSFESARNIRRLGINSLLRSRLWFEIGRIAWHAAFLTFVVAALCSYIAGKLNLNAVETLVWTSGRTVELYCIGVFVAVGSVGYALSLSRWKKPTGRAFECVNFSSL